MPKNIYPAVFRPRKPFYEGSSSQSELTETRLDLNAAPVGSEIIVRAGTQVDSEPLGPPWCLSCLVSLFSSEEGWREGVRIH